MGNCMNCKHYTRAGFCSINNRAKGMFDSCDKYEDK